MSKSISSEKRNIIFNKTNGFCVMCNKKLQLLNYFDNDFCCIDHLIPKTKNGKNHIDNLFPICRSCNCSKNSKNTNDIILDLINNVNLLNEKRFLNVFRYELKQNKESINMEKLEEDFKILIDSFEEKKQILLSSFQDIKESK